MKKNNNIIDILANAVSSKLFALMCPILTVIISALITQITKDWTWVIVAISIALIMLAVMAILSAQISKTHQDMVKEIVKNDGILDSYLTEKISCLTASIETSGSCMKDVQKECKKSIEQFFLKQYSEIKFYNIDQILEFEKEVESGVIWIISDELYTDIENDKISNAVGSNLQDGTIYKYFYTQIDNAIDAEDRLKCTFKERFDIQDIDDKMFFSQISNRYDALVKIAKDIIILNPTKPNRRAFVCIFSNDNFEIAFYRELTRSETSSLCGMIRNKSIISQ